VPRTGGTCLRSDHLDRAAVSVSLKHFQLFGLFCLLFTAIGEIPGASIHHLYYEHTMRTYILLDRYFLFPMQLNRI
jgi:hypothetical protein